MQGEIITERRTELDRARGAPYQAAMLTWLEGKAVHTRRSYMTALRAFLRAAETHPAEIEPLDVAGWKERPKRRSLTDSTMAQPLSVISSYYNLAREETT